MNTSLPIHLDAARLSDIDALVNIENRCFNYDKLSARSFRHMIQKANCDFIVARRDDIIVGYILVLYHRGTHLARLYSLAVLPEARGQRIGDQLLQKGEACATARDCIYMRLEVHTNNTAAIAMYQKSGYHPFGIIKDYYEDHGDAQRFQKRILYPENRFDFLNIPYYQQTTDFTCGPASLIMAMQSLQPDTQADRLLELQIWREATTIYMTSGHGGCSPLGLALAAWRRGFHTQLYLNTDQPLFLDGVRNDEKKAVMELVHQDFSKQIQQTDITLVYQNISLHEIEQQFRLGAIPLVLISTYSYTRDKSPHWVVVSGIDDTFVYIHDPDEDKESFRSHTDNIYLPIARATFDNSFRFGRSGLRTCVLISRADQVS